MPPAPRTLAARLVAVLAAIGGAALLAIMAITVFDIASRSIGLGSVKGLVEYSAVTIVCLACLGAGFCFAKNGHIVVDLATARLKPRLLQLIDAVWLMVAGAMLALMAALIWREGMLRVAKNEETAALAWSPMVYHVPATLGLAVAAIVCTALALRGFAGAAPPPKTK